MGDETRSEGPVTATPGGGDAPAEALRGVTGPGVARRRPLVRARAVRLALPRQGAAASPPEPQSAPAVVPRPRGRHARPAAAGAATVELPRPAGPVIPGIAVVLAPNVLDADPFAPLTLPSASWVVAAPDVLDGLADEAGPVRPPLPGDRGFALVAATSTPRRTAAGRRCGRLLARRTVFLAVGAAVGVAAVLAVPGAGGDGGPTVDTSEVGVRTWVLNNLGADATILLPGHLSAGIAADGHDPANLVGFTAAGAGSAVVPGRCCDYVVVTGSTDAGPADTLPAAVAALLDRSQVVAAFGNADRRAEIRQVLPASAAGTAALAAELGARVYAGLTLLRSPRVAVADAARRDLSAGNVDPRVLLSLTALALRHDISIAGFSALPGESGDQILRRGVELDVLDGAAVRDGSRQVALVLAELARLGGVLRAEGASVLQRASGAVLAIRYAPGAPPGLLTRGAN